MEDKKPVVLDEADWERLYKSEVMENLEFLGNRDSDAMKGSMICQSDFLHKFEVFDRDVKGIYQTRT